jgi:hypothetical protein
MTTCLILTLSPSFLLHFTTVPLSLVSLVFFFLFFVYFFPARPGWAEEGSRPT